MDDIMLKIDNVSKQYRLGQIGGTTLRDELQRKCAKRRGEEDPTKKIGAKNYVAGETFKALDGISFEVKKGERVGIIGHNGAGKSTLLKLISRVTTPTTGMIGMNGRIASMLEVGTGFHPELTGRENIYMNGAILGMTKAEIDAKMEDIIEFSEVRQFIDTPVKRYSSGMYVKLAFSVAAHLDSEIMIMDEVLAVGDMAFQKKCLEKMSEVSKGEGRTILYVSHNMNTIRQLCNRVIVLDHGKVVFDGEVEEGVTVYYGKKTVSENVVELGNLQRSSEFCPHVVTMERIELSDRNTAIFKVGETLNIRLYCKSDKALRNTYLRAIIKTNEGLPVTMQTNDCGFHLEEKQDVVLSFEIDISKIVPGEYTISLVVYEVDECGRDFFLDGLKDIYRFDVIQTPYFNNNMTWKPRYWGYLYNSPIIIHKER